MAALTPPDSDANSQVAVYRRNERLATLVNHLIVALMMVSMSITIMFIASQLSPNWQGSYLPLLCFIVSIEAMYTWRIMRRWADLSVYGFGYWAIEWIILLVFIKLFLYGIRGFDRLFIDLPHFQSDFINTFFDPETLFVFAVSFVVWIISGLYAADFSDLEGDEVLLTVEDNALLLSDRRAVRRRLANRFFVIGFLMVFLTALAYIDYKTLRATPYIGRNDLVNVLVYFILGMVLLSQTHFAMLRATWAVEHLPVKGAIARQWIIYSIIFLALVATVAFILPTSYTLGLLTTLNYLAAVLASVVAFLVMIIALPFFALLGFIMNLLRGTPVDEQQAKAPPTPVIPPPPFTQSPVPWLDLLKSLLFWAILIGVISYAFIQYLRQNKELLERLGRVPLIAWLASTWRWLIEKLGIWNSQVSAAVQSRIKRLLSRSASGLPTAASGFLSLRRLSPRQKVRFYYLALVRRGGEKGLPRKPSQTPYEYVKVLQSNLEDVEEDVEGLTDAFMEARYTRHEIEQQQASRVQQYWERIKQALRGLRKS